jgi:hypothetical protein
MSSRELDHDELMVLRTFGRMVDDWRPGMAPADYYPVGSFGFGALVLLEQLHQAHLRLYVVGFLDRRGRLTRTRARRIARRRPRNLTA